MKSSISPAPRAVTAYELPEWTTRTIPGVSLSAQDRSLTEQLDSESRDGRLTVEELRHGVRVTSRSWVGVVRLSGFEVRVIPKLAGEHIGLVELLDYTTGIDALRRYPNWRSLDTSGHNLLDLLALLLAEACERLLRGGVLADYREIEADIAVIRGRLLADRQVLKHFGQIHRLECRYDERLTDIAENRLLAAALEVCSRRVKAPSVALRIRRLRQVFADVCDPFGLDLDHLQEDLVYHRLNEPYRYPHEIARLILRALGVRQLFTEGGTLSFAFLLDMNKLFEVFVARWLAELLRGTPFQARSQAGTTSILWNADRNTSHGRVIPDVVIARNGVRNQGFPIDAKYKLYDERRLAPADIYQSFLYAFAIGESRPSIVSAAMLLYPSSTVESKVTRLHIKDLRGRVGAEIFACGVHLPSALKEAREKRTGPLGRRLREIVQDRLSRVG